MPLWNFERNKCSKQCLTLYHTLNWYKNTFGVVKVTEKFPN